MDFNDTPSLFFYYHISSKMRKNLVLSHEVKGSSKDLNFKISYVLEKEEKYDNKLYSIIIATYKNNLEESQVSIVAEFGDNTYSSKKLKLKKESQDFVMTLIFKIRIKKN